MTDLGAALDMQVRRSSVIQRELRDRGRRDGDGLLTHLFTRIYFSDESDNARDPVLLLVPAARRDTLIAKREGTGEVATYRFDVHMQGDKETVFFDV